MTFQEKLIIKVRRFLTILLSSITLIFIILYLFISFFDREHLVKTRLDKIENDLVEISDLFDKRISSLSLNETYTDLFYDDSLSLEEVKLDNYNFTRVQNFKVHFTLINQDGKAIFKDETFREAHNLYNDIIYDKVINHEESGMLTYRAIDDVPALVFYGPVYDDVNLLGIAMYYVYTNDLAYYLLNNQGDYVITDRYNNVLVTTHNNFVDRYGKFNVDGNSFNLNDNKFYVTKVDLGEFNIFYLVEKNSELGFFLIFALIILTISMGLVYLVSNKLLKELIENNIKSINKIISDTNIVSSGDLTHKIDENLDSDFGNLASNINQMIDKLNSELKLNQELNEINLLYERKKLDAQFNPHLLYNSLETIRYSMKFDQEGTEKFILNLNSILRYSIDNSVDYVTLKDDISYIKKYIELYHYRLGDKFSWHFDIEDELLDIKIPKLTLQPLIENSIKYGFKSKDTLHIEIKCYEKDDEVVLKVIDNGESQASEYVNEINELLKNNTNNTKHIGLHNIARRVAILYPESKVYVKSEEGMTVTIKIKGAIHVQDCSSRR